jgi:hypothetical protein
MSIGGAPSRPKDVTENSTMLAGIETVRLTEDLESH